MDDGSRTGAGNGVEESMLGGGSSTSLISLLLSSSQHSLHPFKVDLSTGFVVFPF